MSRWKICLGGVAVFAFFIGISYLSLRQVEELSGVSGDISADTRIMDMSSITDESPRYISSEDDGIYGDSHVSMDKALDLENCGVSENMAGVVYLEELRAAAGSGKLEEMVDWLKVPEERKEEAELVMQLFTQCVGDGKGIYMNMQCQIDDSLIVQFMLMDTCSGTVHGRLYDYEHADTLTFTFFKKDDGVSFIPISLL